jgi:hypothetical protein
MQQYCCTEMMVCAQTQCFDLYQCAVYCDFDQTCIGQNCSQFAAGADALVNLDGCNRERCGACDPF